MYHATIMTDPKLPAELAGIPTASVAELIAQATQCAAAGEQGQAHVLWQAASDLAPDNKLAALRLAQSLLGIAGPQAGQAALVALIDRWPTFIPGQLALARHLTAIKDYLPASVQADSVLLTNPYDPAALMIRADCLHHFRRDPEAVDSLRLALQSNPDLPSPRLKLATLCLTLGQFDQVLAFSDGQSPAGRQLTDLYLLAARAQFRLGNHSAAAARFRALQDGGPDDAKVRRAQIQELLGALDFTGADDQIASLLDRHPEDLAGYVMAVQCLGQLGQTGRLWHLLDHAPPAMRQSRAFQLTVRLVACQQQFQVKDCKAIIAADDADDLPVEQALPLIEALWVHGDRQLAYARLSDLLARCPNELTVLRKCTIIFGARDPDHLPRIKAGFLARLAPLDRCHYLAGLPGNRLTAAERLSVVRWKLERGGLQTAAQHRHFLLGFQHETDAGVIGALLKDYHGTAPYFALMTPILAARCARSTAVVGESDPQRHSRICLHAAQLARTDPQSPALLRRIATALTALISANDSPTWMDSAEDRAAAEGLADWLAARIRNRTPTAVIRIGDGEGRFLPYPAGQQQLQAEDQAQVQRDPWWGEVLLNQAQTAKVSAGLRQAMANADVLGIPPMARLGAEFGWPTAFTRRDCRGLTAIFDHLTASPASGLFASCNLHADLDRWGLYGRVLAECTSVTLISCHDLSATLAERFGVATRVFHQLPAEYRYRRSFGEQTEQQKTTRIYPDIFDRIMVQLDPCPGEVHLVAAGFLGKLFCDRIRAKGGIALDIGSQADRWANLATRAYFKAD